MRGVIKIDAGQTGDQALPGINNNRADASEPAQTTSQRNTFLLLALIILSTIIAYSPVLFNFFVGDDYVHLVWLKDAVNHHEMIWRNFHSSWLDGTTTKFYRPLISIFMVSDYLTYGINGLGYHITNLLFHLVSTALIFALVKNLTADQTQVEMQRGTRWALASAAIFALYPLHPEAVSWITGRVDTIVTTFCLGAFYGYIRWRQTRSNSWLCAALISFILGLLSKEMAITIPPVLVAYEILLGGNIQSPLLHVATRRWQIIPRLLATCPFFLVLAGYFVVRWLSLGTFVGGYDDSLFFIADIKSFFLSWLHALRMMVVPLNRNLIGSHSLLTKAWEILTIAAVVLCLIKAIKQRTYWRQFLFTGIWLCFCLLPVYKIFAISDDLQGSRLAYLATVPLSILFAYGLTNLSNFGSIKKRILNNAPIVLTAVLCAVVLWINNQPWRAAGEESNAIAAGLQKIYSTTSDDPQTLLLGLPDQINGAYVCRNAVTGMTTRPQLSRDIHNCLLVNQFEPILPFGYLKESLAKAGAAVHVYRWSSTDKKFISLNITSLSANNATARTVAESKAAIITGTELHNIIAPAVDQSTKLTLEAIGGPLIEASSPSKRASLILQMDNYPCWNTEFIAAKVDVITQGKPGVGADLLYANDISPDFQLPRRTHAETNNTIGKQTWLFPLRSLPEWSFGGSPVRLKLMLPTGSAIKLESLNIVSPSLLIPTLSFANGGYMGTKGYLHLGADKKTQNVIVNASRIPGAATTEIEITRPNLLFEEQNCSHFSKISNVRRAGPLQGSLTLNLHEFPAPGIYELRVWARDRAGAVIGLCSDHIVIAVDR